MELTSPESPPPTARGNRRGPGCFSTLCLTLLAALLILGIIGWKFLDVSLAGLRNGFGLLGGLPEKFQAHRVTETFRESLTRITPTNGDVLELAVVESDETITKFDMKTLFNDTVYLGTTISEIRVPAVYRYHLKLSDEWKLTTSGNVLTVIAPVIRPSLPPAIRTERMEKKSESGWLRFNADENLAELEKNVTPTLERRAGSPGKIKQASEACRKSVAEFVKNWLLKEGQWKQNSIAAIVVIFADEPAAKNVSAGPHPATISLQGNVPHP